jgi:regulatory protein
MIRRSGSHRDDTSEGRRVVPPDDGGFETVARNAGPAFADVASAVHPQAVPPRKPRSGPSLKARAVGYLSRREYARSELARKLKPYLESDGDHGDDEKRLEAVLDDLEREGWLSTDRFAKSLVHRRSSKQGTSRIVQELRQHGVAEDQISELRDTLRSSEYERASAVWQKRYGEKPADRSAYAKQARFLAARGFAHDVIRRVLGSGGGDDESI